MEQLLSVNQGDPSSLKVLIKHLKVWINDSRFAQPTIVVNRQTLERHRKDLQFQSFMTYFESFAKVLITWNVDTCAMWLSGLGEAFDKSRVSNNGKGSTFWLIPGDYDYASPEGQIVLKRMRQLPEIVHSDDNQVELCLGEIEVPSNSSKELIDFWTYNLIFNWLPGFGQAIRMITTKPRTEFFAISHNRLEYALARRWYAYEQTVVIMFEILGVDDFKNCQIEKIQLGKATDSDEHRDSLCGALQQIERCDRMLRNLWRETVYSEPHWVDRYRLLSVQAEQIKSAATVVLEQLLLKL